MRSKIKIASLIASLLLTACGLRALPSAQKLQGSLAGQPCPENKAFTCLPLRVPLDHANPQGRQLDLVFALHPASGGKSQGMLVTVDGGPGYSGIDGMTLWQDVSPELEEKFDLVSFDLRGVKRSSGIDCPKAAAAYYLGGLRAEGEIAEKALLEKTRRFTIDCVSETGYTPQELQHFNTSQAIDDLETFRRAMGSPLLTLYGMSYGTQFAQAYARRYPQAVKGLLLDGVVNLQSTHLEFASSLPESASRILHRTFEECRRDQKCLDAFGKSTESLELQYEKVVADLTTGPREMQYPLPNGGTARRFFTRNDLDTTTYSALGEAETRYQFLQALAAIVVKKNYVPMQTLVYEGSGIAPEDADEYNSEERDPGMSNAVYYAFTCNDYGWLHQNEGVRERVFLERGRQLQAQGHRMVSAFYGEFPCLYWPSSKTPSLPSPGAIDTPTLVIGATGDDSTPYEHGLAVVKAGRRARALTFDGGRHVMMGQKEPCLNEPAAAFLLRGELPKALETVCPGPFLSAQRKAASERARGSNRG